MSMLPKINDTGQYHQVFQAIIPGRSHRATVTNTSIVSSEFQPDTTVVRFTPTENCWILFGNSLSTTAAVNDGDSTYLQGGVVTILGVPDQCNRVAVILDDEDPSITTGKLHVVEAR